MTEDLGENDGPVSPIIINNNLIDLVITPGAEGEQATVKMRPEVAPWRVVNRVKTVAAGEQGDIQIGSPKYGVIVATGTIAADSDPALKVEHFSDPPRFARTAFIEALERAGVTVSGNPTAPNPAAQLPPAKRVDGLPAEAKLEGLTLDQNATYILKVSYNRGAQTQVCLLAAAVGSRNCDDGFPEMAKIFEFRRDRPQECLAGRWFGPAGQLHHRGVDHPTHAGVRRAAGCAAMATRPADHGRRRVDRDGAEGQPCGWQCVREDRHPRRS